MRKTKISAVVNTWNEEKNLAECLESLNFADELIVVDMDSTDQTLKIAKKYTDKVYRYPYVGYVEPARNFAIGKAQGPWVLVVDADERVPKDLVVKLIEIIDQDEAEYVRLPRQNLIFGAWLKHSRWWPDYNIRFFKKGSVTWQDAIHSIPVTTGRALDLPAEKKFALIHQHYSSIDEYLTRQIRYANQQAKELLESGYQLNFSDLVNKPASDFLSRFFAGEGYKDGLHGFIMATLQSFATFLIYLKVWQAQGFVKSDDNLVAAPKWRALFRAKYQELRYWIYTVEIHLARHKLRRQWLRFKRKFNL